MEALSILPPKLIRKYLMELTCKIVENGRRVNVTVSPTRIHIGFPQEARDPFVYELDIEPEKPESIRLILVRSQRGVGTVFYHWLIKEDHPCFLDVMNFYKFANQYNRLSAEEMNVLCDLHYLITE